MKINYKYKKQNHDAGENLMLGLAYNFVKLSLVNSINENIIVFLCSKKMVHLKGILHFSFSF